MFVKSDKSLLLNIPTRSTSHGKKSSRLLLFDISPFTKDDTTPKIPSHRRHLWIPQETEAEIYQIEIEGLNVEATTMDQKTKLGSFFWIRLCIILNPPRNYFLVIATFASTL